MGASLAHSRELRKLLRLWKGENTSNLKGRCAILFLPSSLYHLLCHLNAIPHISSSNLKVKEEESHLMFYLWKIVFVLEHENKNRLNKKRYEGRNIFPLLFALP